jgi:hypothetical protein
VASLERGDPRPLILRRFAQGPADQDGDGLPPVLHVGIRLGQGRGVLVGGDAARAGERVVIDTATWAKQKCVRRCSTKPTPVSPASSGNRTAVMSSSGLRAVWNGPRK